MAIAEFASLEILEREYSRQAKRFTTPQDFIQGLNSPQWSRNYLHNIMMRIIGENPERFGAPEKINVHYEVPLSRLNGSKITALDVAGVHDDECYIWDAVSTTDRTTTNSFNGRRKLREAVKFFYYNFGIVPNAYFVYLSEEYQQKVSQDHNFHKWLSANDLRASPVSTPELNPAHKGIFL